MAPSIWVNSDQPPKPPTKSAMVTRPTATGRRADQTGASAGDADTGAMRGAGDLVEALAQPIAGALDRHLGHDGLDRVLDRLLGQQRQLVRQPDQRAARRVPSTAVRRGLCRSAESSRCSTKPFSAQPAIMLEINSTTPVTAAHSSVGPSSEAAIMVAARPIAAPIATRHVPSRNTRLTISPRLAPSARRIPNSRVRCATRYDMIP